MWGRACWSGLESWDRELGQRDQRSNSGPSPSHSHEILHTYSFSSESRKTGQQLNEERYLNFLPLLWPNAQPQQTCAITVYRHKYWGHWARECTDPREPTTSEMLMLHGGLEASPSPLLWVAETTGKARRAGIIHWCCLILPKIHCEVQGRASPERWPGLGWGSSRK